MAASEVLNRVTMSRAREECLPAPGKFGRTIGAWGSICGDAPKYMNANT